MHVEPTVGGSVSPAASSNMLVEFRSLTKTFGATRALKGVSFGIRAGETVGLLGANGAGKSTLIKTLAGIHRATSGSIIVEGQECSFDYPDDARNAGIATVHQNIDDGVVFGMSVAENLLLDEIAKSSLGFFLTEREIKRRAKQVEEKLKLDLPLGAPVEELSPSRRQEVAIARELAKNPKLLILDEPTSTLSEREAEKLFAAVKDFQNLGIAILYITHRMSEVEMLCDRVVVLRNGEIVSEHERPLDTRAIAGSILGELILTQEHESREGTGAPVLEARAMRCRPDTAPIDLELRRGEVVGLTGLIGAGKTEILEQICGYQPLISGEMKLDGANFRPRDTRDAMNSGVVMVPEQRALQSIFPTDDLWKHSTIGFLEDFCRFGFMARNREKQFTQDVIDDFRVVCPGPDAAIEELSGGNQQKLLVGRWLKRGWKVFILDEPFRGIDIGARGLISRALRSFSQDVPVLICSSDPEEVIEVADRVLIMVESEIVHEDKAENMTAESLMEIMSRPVTGETAQGDEARLR
ncbi:MAG: sugar ABC transporter ATP-binding protein [Pseudomonadota bacterium]